MEPLPTDSIQFPDLLKLLEEEQTGQDKIDRLLASDEPFSVPGSPGNIELGALIDQVISGLSDGSDIPESFATLEPVDDTISAPVEPVENNTLPSDINTESPQIDPDVSAKPRRRSTPKTEVKPEEVKRSNRKRKPTPTSDSPPPSTSKRAKPTESTLPQAESFDTFVSLLTAPYNTLKHLTTPLQRQRFLVKNMIWMLRNHPYLVMFPFYKSVPATLTIHMLITNPTEMINVFRAAVLAPLPEFDQK